MSDLAPPTRRPEPSGPAPAPREDLAFALWELLPHLADAGRLLKDYGETKYARQLQALIDRHWTLGAEGAAVAFARGIPACCTRPLATGEGNPNTSSEEG